MPDVPQRERGKKNTCPRHSPMCMPGAFAMPLREVHPISVVELFRFGMVFLFLSLCPLPPSP